MWTSDALDINFDAQKIYYIIQIPVTLYHTKLPNYYECGLRTNCRIHNTKYSLNIEPGILLYIRWLKVRINYIMASEIIE